MHTRVMAITATALVGIILLVATPAAAQRPGAVRTVQPTGVVLGSVAERIAANDSLGALGVLDTALVYDRKNGALWNRYGQIAWGMSKTEKGPMMRPQMIRLRMRADSAFRYATAFAPDSAKYYLDLGLYGLETNLVWIRAGAQGTFRDGIERAVAQGRDSIAAALMDQVGMFAWRDYDGVANRALVKSPYEIPMKVTPLAPLAEPSTPMTPKKAGAVQLRPSVGERFERGDMVRYYRETLSTVTPATGEGTFVKATTLFRDALTRDATNARARRHMYMALADHHSWPDLLRETDNVLREDPDIVEAWLSRGLAASWLRDYNNAAIAFDNALKRMSTAERARFTNIKRLMAPTVMDPNARMTDSLKWDALSAEERRRQETLFWSLADPRQSTRLNEATLEFYARVVFADLRFGSEEFRIRGADSHRGDTYVRYGPPDETMSTVDMGSTTIYWLYDKKQLAFTFSMAPSFGTAYIPRADEWSVDSIHSEVPVSWDNMPLAKSTWPMRLRVARFRATADSMDAVVTNTVPVRSLLEGAELAGQLPIAVQLDVNDPLSRIVGREIRTVNVQADTLPIGINGAWVRRLGRGTNVIRVDAEQVDVQRAASATIDVSVDTTSGFGLSDLLLGTNPRSSGSAAPARWRDVSIAPTTGAFSWAQPIGVIWEAYDLVPDNGSVRYRVNLTVDRTFKSLLRGLVARVAAFSKNVVERDLRGLGSVSIGFEQLRAAAPTITDFLSIDLNGSVPGTYKLTIEIEDLVAKRKTSRTTTFELRKD